MSRILTDEEKQQALKNTHIDYFVDWAAKGIVDAVAQAQRDLSDRENGEAIRILTDNFERCKLALKESQDERAEAIQQTKRETAEEIIEMSIDFYAMTASDFRIKYDLANFKGIYVFSEVLKARYLSKEGG